MAYVPPTVQIENGPADGDTLAYNNPAFTWSGTDADGFIDSFHVELTGPSPRSFSTTGTFVQLDPVANGGHIFCVTAIDNTGTASEPDCRTFVVDIPVANVPPTVQIDNGPADGDTLDYNNPAFTWSGADPDGAIEEYFVDLAGLSPTAFSTTATFVQFDPLASGHHIFCVTAIDDDGEASEPDCRGFTIDIPVPNVPPTVQIDNGPADGDTLGFNSPAFTWTGNDVDGIVDSFQVDMAGPTAAQFGTTSTFYQFNALTNGAYSFCVNALDDRGGISEPACRTFHVAVAQGNSAPTVSIENGPAEGSTITFNNPAFSWSGSDTDGVVDSFHVALTGPSAQSFSTTTTFFQFPALISGVYTFCVQSEDNDGGRSGWACRNFTVGNAVVGSVKDLVIGEKGQLLHIPLANVPVQIYQLDALVSTTSTDEKGEFSFSGVFTGSDYELRITATAILPDKNEPVAIRYRKSAAYGSSFDVILPLALSLEQYALLNALSDLHWPEEFIFGAAKPLRLDTQYDVAVAEELIGRWIDDLDVNSDEVTQTLTRLFLVESLLYESFGLAAELSHETTETLFLGLDTYFTSKEVLDSANRLLATGDDLVAQTALDGIFQKIGELNYDLNVGMPARAAVLIPEPFGSSVHRALLRMHEAVYRNLPDPYPDEVPAFSLMLSRDAVKNRVFAAGNQAFFEPLYIPPTQAGFDESITAGAGFDISGSFPGAFSKTVSVDEGSVLSKASAVAEATRLKSDSLQNLAHLSAVLANMELLIAAENPWTAALRLSDQSRAVRRSQWVEALARTATRLSEMPAEIRHGIGAALWPDNPQPMPDTTLNDTPKRNFDSQQVASYQTALASRADEYFQLLDQIVNDITAAKRDTALSRLPDLFDLDEQLSESMLIGQAPVIAAAGELNGDPDFTEAYSAMQQSAFDAVSQRMMFYGQLLEYLDASIFNTSLLAMRRDSIVYATGISQRLSTEALELATNIPAPSLVLVAHHRINREIVTPGFPFQLVAKIKNTGPIDVTDVSVSLKTDSLAALLAPATVNIPALAADEEIELSWNLQVIDPRYDTGAYLLQIDAPGGKPLSAVGIYPINWTALTTAVDGAAALPADYSLKQNYPNPFHSWTTILFELPVDGIVSITLYDMLGRQIATLLDERKEAGRHTLSWNSRNVSSGAYMLRFTANDFMDTRQIVVVK